MNSAQCNTSSVACDIHDFVIPARRVCTSSLLVHEHDDATAGEFQTDGVRLALIQVSAANSRFTVLPGFALTLLKQVGYTRTQVA